MAEPRHGRRGDDDDDAQSRRPEQSDEDKQQLAANEQREGASGHAQQTPMVGPESATQPSEQSAIRPSFTPAPQVGANPIAEAGGREISASELASQAEDREKARARSRGVPEQELEDLAANTIWVVSNRLDDRVVPGSWERDPRHPGGESFVAGPTPARVYRTTTMERLILGGELIEVDPPMATVQVTNADGEKVTVRNRKMPVEIMVDPATTWAAQPGHPTPIGRKLDKELFSADTIRKVSSRQRQLPAAVPVPPGGYVPRHTDVDRPA